ncbi:hypothetical protein, partial [Mycolicibacterium arseniciresistens]
MRQNRDDDDAPAATPRGARMAWSRPATAGSGDAPHSAGPARTADPEIPPAAGTSRRATPTRRWAHREAAAAA